MSMQTSRRGGQVGAPEVVMSRQGALFLRRRVPDVAMASATVPAVWGDWQALVASGALPYATLPRREAYLLRGRDGTGLYVLLPSAWRSYYPRARVVSDIPSFPWYDGRQRYAIAPRFALAGPEADFPAARAGRRAARLAGPSRGMLGDIFDDIAEVLPQVNPIPGVSGDGFGAGIDLGFAVACAAQGGTVVNGECVTQGETPPAPVPHTPGAFPNTGGPGTPCPEGWQTDPVNNEFCVPPPAPHCPAGQFFDTFQLRCVPVESVNNACLPGEAGPAPDGFCYPVSACDASTEDLRPDGAGFSCFCKPGLRRDAAGNCVPQGSTPAQPPSPVPVEPTNPCPEGLAPRRVSLNAVQAGTTECGDPKTIGGGLTTGQKVAIGLVAAAAVGGIAYASSQGRGGRGGGSRGRSGGSRGRSGSRGGSRGRSGSRRR